MQNIFKKTALILIAALSVVCIGIFAAACNNEKATDFVITVLDKDGNKIELSDNGEYTVQICDADNMFCYSKDPVIVDGNATYNIEAVNAQADKVYSDGNATHEYVVHVIHIGEIRKEVELTETVTVKQSNAEVTVQLKG